MPDTAWLAALHERCFTLPPPWSVADFAGLIAQSSVFVEHERDLGFVMGRVVVDEAELLTLAVTPESRRQGIGQRLLACFEVRAARQGAVRAFLEVASRNAAASGLYRSAGWSAVGRRKGYLRSTDGSLTDDALILEKYLLR